MDVRVKAYAKLNLTLQVGGVTGGYHSLDSVVCTVDCFDLIKLKKRKDKLVFLRMHGRGSESIPPEKNNAQKAAEAYVERFETCGADIEIYKNIPVGAGMGGSSADVAGVLNGMAKLYGKGNFYEIKDLADGLGSDSGYLLTGGYARLTGRGEKVKSLSSRLKLNVLALIPPSGVSTAQCYALCDGIPCEGGDCAAAEQAVLSESAELLAESMGNGLSCAAGKLNGDVEKAYKELCAFSPLGVNMTGSGSGVFAVFESAELCAWAKSRYRGKFECMQLKTVVPYIKSKIIKG